MSHPYLIHLPIALVFLWPLVDGAGLWLKRPDVSTVGFALLLLALMASFVAVVSGQSAFDAAIAQKADPALLDTHASPAGLVPWSLLVIVLVRSLGVVRLNKRAHFAAIVLGFLAWPLMYQVAAAGGALVYRNRIGVERSAIERDVTPVSVDAGQASR